MANLDEKQIAMMLRELPSPPGHWVERAKAIPRVERQLDQVLPLLESEAQGRKVQTAELEKAIEAAGLEPEADLIEALVDRIGRETGIHGRKSGEEN